MEHTEVSQNGREHRLLGATEDTDGDPKPSVEPDSWRDLTEFVDQFDDAVFGILTDPNKGAKGYWIIRDIEKVRPSAVPIDQGPTFDLSVLGPGGEVVDELRLTIDEIEHIRAAEPSVELSNQKDTDDRVEDC